MPDGKPSEAGSTKVDTVVGGEKGSCGKYEFLETADFEELLNFDLTETKLKVINKPSLALLFTRLQGFIRESEIGKLIGKDPTEALSLGSCKLCPLLLSQVKEQVDSRVSTMEEMFRTRNELTIEKYHANTKDTEFQSQLASLNTELGVLRDENTALKLQQKDLDKENPTQSFWGNFSANGKMKKSDSLPMSKDPVTKQHPGKKQVPTVATSATTSSNASLPHKPAVIIGTSAGCDDDQEEATLVAVRKAPRPRIDGLFLSRLQPNTRIEQIENFIKRTTGTDVEVERLQTKHDGYASFHVTCGVAVNQKLLKADVWPEGTLVKPFFQRPEDSNM